MHLASDPKHLIVHMFTGFLIGMRWVIDQEEEGMTCAWKWCEHKNCFNLQGQKNLIKMKNMHSFLKV